MEHRINSIHKRALKLIYQDSHDLTFEELLAKDKSVSVQTSLLIRFAKFTLGIPGILEDNLCSHQTKLEVLSQTELTLLKKKYR